MITLYSFIVFLHVLGAAVWIGAAAALEFLGWKIFSTAEKNIFGIEDWLLLGEWFGKYVFAPAGSLTIVAGLILVSIGWAQFGQLWIILALTAVFLSLLIGMVGIAKLTRRILSELNNEKSDENRIDEELKKMKMFANLDLALLLFLLFDMVMKPKSFEPVFVSLVVAFFVLVILFILFGRRIKKLLFGILHLNQNKNLIK